MSTESDVVALFEHANPVPDPDAIDIVVTADQRLADARHDVLGPVTVIDGTKTTTTAPGRRGWVIPAAAAAVLVVALVAGLSVIGGDETEPGDSIPTIAPTPTTIVADESADAPSAADLALVDAFFAAYNAGETDAVLAMLADGAVVTEFDPDEPYLDWDQRLAWNLAQGEILTEPTCALHVEQPAEDATLLCTYDTLDAVVQAADGRPIPTSTYFTVVDGEFTVIDQRYGFPDFATLGTPFTQWIVENHPDVTGALFHGWTSREEAVEHGLLRSQWAQEWARSLDDEVGEAAPTEPQPAVVAPALGAPIDGETQQSIVGDVTWTRVDGDITTLPSDVVFEHDGTFFGNRLSYGQVDQAELQPQWFTSPDGVTWIPWAEVPASTELTLLGDTLWAESVEFRPDGDPALRYWDGTGLVRVEIPASDEVPGEGLTLRSRHVSMKAEFDGRLVVKRSEGFGVPWEELLGLEPPLEAFEEGGSWEGTFRVRSLECTVDSPFGRGCGSRAESRTWRIRPEVVGGSPARVDLYDDDTGELITSVVAPDDGVSTDDVVSEIGCCNSVGGRTDYLVADRDGTNARAVDWPFIDAPFDSPSFAQLGGRLFALTDSDTGGELRLWVTDDLDTWQELALPATIEQRDDTFSWLVSDGDTMIMNTRGPFGPGLVEASQPMWITPDGTNWTAWEAPLAGHPTRGAGAADFGWMDFLDETGDPEAPVIASPALAVSPDAETWQVVPIPIPAALADRSLTWADTHQVDDEPHDFTLEWGWEAYAHGDTIFIALRSFDVNHASELWVGKVGAG